MCACRRPQQHPHSRAQQQLLQQLRSLEDKFLHAGGWRECLDATGAVSRHDMPSTTPYHLAVTLAQGDWAMAGFDLTCLATGVFFAWAAWKMRHAGQVDRVSRPRAQPMPLEQEAN